MRLSLSQLRVTHLPELSEYHIPQSVADLLRRRLEQERATFLDAIETRVHEHMHRGGLVSQLQETSASWD